MSKEGIFADDIAAEMPMCLKFVGSGFSIDVRAFFFVAIVLVPI